jgi:hypothetical protein
MTLIIATTNPEGVVLSADSRQTYTNRSGVPRIASDNATKIIQLSETAVVATAGPAFFSDAGSLRSIQSYLEEFRDTLMLPNASDKLTDATEIANALDTYCQRWIERTGREGIQAYVNGQQGSGLAMQAIADGKIPYDYKDPNGAVVHYEWRLLIPQFIVAARDRDGICRALSVVPFGGIGLTASSSAPQLIWTGQTEVLSKLLTGPDPFVISTATMTIQDAVDFSVLLTRTTENLHKFSDGTAASQGGVPGVGGPIDIVLIPKKGNIEWLSRKLLHAERLAGQSCS